MNASKPSEAPERFAKLLAREIAAQKTRSSSSRRMGDMRKSKFTEEQIIGFLKQAEAGMAVAEICRKGSRTPHPTRP